MRLICYTTSGDPPRIIPAPVERTWMDATGEGGHAYRCLPLNIANAHGWMLLNTAAFTAEWNGGKGLPAVTVRPLEDEGSGAGPMLGESHFGSGVLTFHVRGLFRTEPGYDLMVAGPANMPKDAIQPLTGVVETDWSNFTFTMNWIFTRPHTPVTFARDEPFCMIYPVKRGLIDEVRPEIHPIESVPDVHAAYQAWADSRRGFNRDLTVPGSEARAQKWQKDYFRGGAGFAQGPPDHRTKLRPRPFTLPQRWRPGGPMDRLVHEQTDANRIGRGRLDEGVLTPTPETVRLGPDHHGPDRGPDHGTNEGGAPGFAPDFVYEPDFLGAADCALLARAARGLTRASDAETADDDALMDQVALFDAVARAEPEAAALMRDTRRRVTERLTGFYELILPLYADSAQLVRLSEGMWLDPHAVNAHADDRPHPAAFRDFAAVLWLNDDCEGGEVYFPRLDLVVRPRAGTLLAFTAGWAHEHGVTEITQGDQLTLSLFHTFHPGRRNAALYEDETQTA